MNPVTVILILVMTLAGTFGALFFKKASSAFTGAKIYQLLLNKNLYFGGIFYVLGALTNILLLRRLDYTLVYPMTTLTYVWTLIISSMLFGERINRNKAIALGLIICGAALVSAA